ncbi:MAG: FadR/GntR family transcriptional regulator [Enterocloster clostridioformis]
MNLKAVKKVNIGDQVYNQMKDQIMSGVWVPGEKIPSENQLMEVFGVSRGTVRQAIQKLSAVGLLETRRGRIICGPAGAGQLLSECCAGGFLK